MSRKYKTKHGRQKLNASMKQRLQCASRICIAGTCVKYDDMLLQKWIHNFYELFDSYQQKTLWYGAALSIPAFFSSADGKFYNTVLLLGPTNRSICAAHSAQLLQCRLHVIAQYVVVSMSRSYPRVS